MKLKDAEKIASLIRQKTHLEGIHTILKRWFDIEHAEFITVPIDSKASFNNMYDAIQDTNKSVYNEIIEQARLSAKSTLLILEKEINRIENEIEDF